MKGIARSAVDAVLVALVLTGTGWANPAPGPAAGAWTSVHSGTFDDLRYVRFFDADNGVMLGTGPASTSRDSLLSTSSAGEQWTVSELPTLGDGIEGVFFLDPLHGWAADSTFTPEVADCILSTVDGGKNWVCVEKALPKLGATLFFADAKVGYAAGAASQHRGGGFCRTTDGGLTWHDVGGEGEDAPSEEALDDVFFVNALEGGTVSWHSVLDHYG